MAITLAVPWASRRCRSGRRWRSKPSSRTRNDAMKLAIDSYCYHRYFGEVYPDLQTDPGKRMTVWDFIKRAKKHGVDGVSLESCFLPSFDDGFLDQLRDTLDEQGFERVWA